MAILSLNFFCYEQQVCNKMIWIVKKNMCCTLFHLSDKQNSEIFRAGTNEWLKIVPNWQIETGYSAMTQNSVINHNFNNRDKDKHHFFSLRHHRRK